MGIKSKQAIRLHMRSAHLIDVPDVMKSEYVENIDIDKEMIKAVDTTKEVMLGVGNSKSVANEYELISEVLNKGLGNAQFREALRKAKQKGFIEINLKTLNVRG